MKVIDGLAPHQEAEPKRQRVQEMKPGQFFTNGSFDDGVCYCLGNNTAVVLKNCFKFEGNEYSYELIDPTIYTGRNR